MKYSKELDKLYLNPESGFVGAQKLFTVAKKSLPDITLADIKSYLKHNETNQVYQPAKRDSESMNIVGRIGHFQADLTFFNQYNVENDGYTIILVAIEVNNRRAYTMALKKKSGLVIAKAIQSMFQKMKENNDIITTLQTDRGVEFNNPEVRDLCSKLNIKQEFTTVGDKKALGKAERMNGTIKMMIRRYMTAKKTHRWIDVLAKLTKNYNNSIHSAINQAPNSVSLDDEKFILGEAMENIILHSSRVDIKVGDYVRLPISKTLFSKYGKNYTDTVHKVVKVNKKTLSVENNQLLFDKEKVLIVPPGSKDIPTIDKPDMGKDVYIAERIVDTKKEGKKTLYLVKWKGYSALHNTWEGQDNILDKRLITYYESKRGRN